MDQEPEILNCKQLVELTTEHSEGALTPYDQRRWDRHLKVCPGCVAHVRSYDVTVNLVSRMPEEPLSSRLENSLLDIHRRWSAGVCT